jgi:hypothetical protein
LGATGALFGPVGLIAFGAVGLGVGAGVVIFKKIKASSNKKLKKRRTE